LDKTAEKRSLQADMAENQQLFRVLIVDDHPMMRRGFGDCLIDTGRFLIAGEAESLEAGRAMLEHLKAPPDLIILDIGLGDENGLDFIKIAKDLYAARNMAAPPVLIYSVFEDPFRVQAAMQLGARGYVSKSAGEPELLRAIDRALAGERHIDEKLEVTAQKTEGLYDLFTRREREILMLVKQHYDNRRIAALCGITSRTVENHLSHIYYKTGLKKREQLLSL
jgi:NarL family two-component system response regulator LiaR